MSKHLVLILLTLVTNNVEELQAVLALGGADHTEPVTELLLLEELLGPVVQCISLAVVIERRE